MGNAPDAENATVGNDFAVASDLTFCKKMRHQIVLFTMLLTAPSVFPESSEGEAFEKKVHLVFTSDDDAKNWSFGTLTLDDWVAVMAKPDWKILQKSETKEFFVAIWRTANQLIFHQYPKPGTEYGYTVEVESVPDVGSGIVVRQDNVSIRYQISSSNEDKVHHDSFTALLIKDGYTGEITLSCTAESNGEVTQYKVPWNRKAGPDAGANAPR